MVESGLCSWCSAWDLSELGYTVEEHQRLSYRDYEAQFDEIDGEDENETHENETIEGGEAEGGSGDEGAEEYEDDLTDEESIASSHSSQDENAHKLLLAMELAKTCIMCQKVSSVFLRWAIEHYGSLERLSLSDAKVKRSATTLTAETHADDDRAIYLTNQRIDIHVRNPDSSEDWIGPQLHFHRSAPHPPNVSAICDNMGASPVDWPQQSPYIGRIRPLVADLRLFKKWKELCTATHGEKCQPEKMHNSRRPLMIRLIDVKQKCLIEADSETVSWVALSYVWGTKSFPVLKLDMLDEFKKPGAFSEPWVPDTILDAIKVTKGIGERYLWTDSLCIIQNSATDKVSYIGHMDIIYGLATLTIVNGAGDSAFSGLPGTRPSTRSEIQEPFQVNGVWAMKSLDPSGSGLSSSFVSDSKWITRGWTFQEGILSQRMLVFAPEVVYWECKQATWREDACWELPDHEEQNQAVFYRSALSDSIFQDLWNPSVEKFDKVYQSLVRRYSERILSHGNDRLNAFAGVLTALQNATGIDFIWGLPKRFLGTALTWPAYNTVSKRQDTKCKVKLNSGDLVDTLLPSWSWVGWITEVYFEELFGYLDGKHAGLEYYVVSECGEIEHVPQNQDMRVRETVLPSEPYTEAESLWKGDTSARVSISDIPAALLVPGIRSTLLIFWTSCAELEIDHRDNSVWHNGEKFKVIWDHTPCGKREHRALAEFIVVGRDSLEHIREISQLTVFVVERDEMGAMNRVGQGMVYEEHWNALENRSWELVFLV